MTTPQPKPAESEALSSPRAPMATGTKEQKARYDTLLGILKAKTDLSMDDVLAGADWIILGPDDEETP